MNVLKYIGIRNIEETVPQQIHFPFGPGEGTLNVSTYICEDDPFLSYLYSDIGCNGVVIQNKSNTYNNYGFTSGYLTSLTLRGGVGEIPQMDASFTIFGQAGRIDSTDSPQIAAQLTTIGSASDAFSPNISGPGTISVTLDDFNTNRLQSLEVTISNPRLPLYVLGQRTPYDVKLIYPQESALTFNFEPDTYVPNKMFDYPSSPIEKNITVSFKNYSTSKQVLGYVFPYSFVDGESYNMNVDSNLQTTLSFRTWNTRYLLD